VGIAIVAGLLTRPIALRVAHFESHQSEIADLLHSATRAEQKLPQSVHDLLLFSMNGHSAPYAASLLLQRLDGGIQIRHRPSSETH
jgi:hypothetical protein